MTGTWDLVALGEVATVRSGYPFKSTDWVDAGIPVVKIANVKQGRLDLAGCSYVAPETAERADEFALVEGDLVIAMTGNIGTVARVSSRDLPCVLNQRVGLFRIIAPDRLDAFYLFSILRRAATRKAIAAMGYGSVQPNVSPKLILGLQIPLPPVSTQVEITKPLRLLHAKTELNRDSIETLEALGDTLFESWLAEWGEECP